MSLLSESSSCTTKVIAAPDNEMNFWMDIANLIN